MIIFDTETTDLNPRLGQIAQLSYVKLDENYKVEFSKNFYFAIDNIDVGASRINGFTVKSLEKLSDNKRFSDFADEIFEDFKKAKLVIAHNIEFDKGFLIEEFKRVDKDISELNCVYFCTMQYYTEILCIPHEYYGYKFPQLSEVVGYLKVKRDKLKQETSNIFNIDIDIDNVNYHDARFDVIATMNIYKYVNCDFQKYDSMKQILSNISSLESSLIDTRTILKEKKLEDISIDDMDTITNFFSEIKEDDCRFSSALYLLDKIKNSANSMHLCIEKELERMKKMEELKLKEVIEQVLNNPDTTIIKAVLKEENNFNRLYRTILFDIQAYDSFIFDCPLYNVDIINIDEEKYLALNYSDEDAYMIKIDTEKTDYLIYGTKFDAYSVIEIEKIPFEICFPERFYDIENFKTTQ